MSLQNLIDKPTELLKYITHIIDSELLELDKSHIWTPDNISKQMASYLYKDGDLLEPAVGKGNLLSYVDVDKYNCIDVFDINRPYLDECISNEHIYKYCADFLKTDISKMYKNIIMNPPYIKLQDLSQQYRQFIKTKWDILNNGNIDIYFAFIIKCIEHLHNDGIMVSITPNSYIYNKSAHKLRKYLIDNRYIQQIIDFKDMKVFPQVSVYCCITIFSKTKKQTFIYNDVTYDYNNVCKHSYNIFTVPKKTNTLTIGDVCEISNGIATLRDKIYIHSEKLYDEECWKIIVTPKKDKWIIFPYNETGVLIKEDVFKNNNPMTYAYLQNHATELNKRDKGKKSMSCGMHMVEHNPSNNM